MPIKLVKWIVGLLVAGILVIGFKQTLFAYHRKAAAQPEKTTKVAVKSKTTRHVKSTSQSIDWHKPSMTKAYPDLAAHPQVKLEVSIAKQRVYLIDQGKTLYTMRASTGKKGSATPKGHFKIQAERGTHFYNAASGEGANYWVSFKDHGIYLFHSVPVDASGHYVAKEAEQLGKKSNSHGCVRLSIADAKWLYEHIRQGTPVIIS
ncbi:L,D-transpeptidase [Lactiplantibacillus mudanjiangensis]|uniref:Cell surface protein [Lactobacillus pentosus] n=1 Tax=Lactiplantibacillus mudanjiangensis TaxID=1296538 RepID=A0A660DXL6_9LACO|nr:L,D-transpeptidase [Lactiplantibacillus mudanjiangensis]VDG18043.1 cell surface protein [Lactobacillus pentosus] [Lactiplantibacillus mudanjiangensis]VDG24790.1 cell surface protein [Lactobacillus pentosus] [Lactiplantibacillus mudanjiangensis]VDG28464.1 cell surface protein [Lactobacillus pentosus] [Lactiplantibacillus mudanjiangensis]VDG32253.1 cell surface protein [Lactobacillus pentosus] [Lactiplantibacillus mudanjiangensis]